jgi:hypothetical protein
MGSRPYWPELPYEDWRDTLATLHLWTQIIGKVRLGLAPWVNHGWQVALYVTASGLGTSPMPFDAESLELDFDFIHQRLVGRTSRGEAHAFRLEPQTVAEFYHRVEGLLASLGVAVAIHDLPSEWPDPIPFSQDRVHATYDPAAAQRFWRALVQADRAFKRFRSGFLGKASPVHFFWGAFDLAATRFSGRPAPPHPGGFPGFPTTSPAKRTPTRSAARASGRGARRTRGRRSTPTPTPSRRASAKNRSLPAPITKRRWASSSCRTRRSGPRGIPRPGCWTSCSRPTPPRRRPAAGTARRSSARWAFLDGCARSAETEPAPGEERSRRPTSRVRCCIELRTGARQGPAGCRSTSRVIQEVPPRPSRTTE